MLMLLLLLPAKQHQTLRAAEVLFLGQHTMVREHDQLARCPLVNESRDHAIPDTRLCTCGVRTTTPCPQPLPLTSEPITSSEASHCLRPSHGCSSLGVSPGDTVGLRASEASRLRSSRTYGDHLFIKISHTQHPNGEHPLYPNSAYNQIAVHSP